MQRKRSNFGSASMRLLLLVGMMLSGLCTLVFSFSGTALAATQTVATCDESHVVTAMNAATDGDVINFSCSGTITLTSALPNIVHNVTLDGSGQSVTLDGANEYQLLAITGSTANVTVKNLTFAHGYSSNGGAIVDTSSSGTLTLTGDSFSHNMATGNSGGAVTFAGTGTFIVTNSIFSNNSGDGYGGAICDIGGDLTVTGSTFSSNTAPSEGQGGAIYYSGGATLTVNGSTFSSNTATYYGGAIYDGNSSTATIGSSGAGNGNTFTSNTATYEGGAIDNAGNITVNIEYDTFTSNSTTATDGDTYGGAIYNNVTSGPGTTAQIVEYDTFTSNTATAASTNNAYGGAIYNEGSKAYLFIQASTFSGNAATTISTGVANGGALYNNSPNIAPLDGFSLEMISSTLTGNSATSGGGAIYNAGNGVTGVYGSTIVRNSITPASSLGAGIYNDNSVGDVYVGGSIIANNTPDNCHISSGVPVTDAGYNLESGTDCNFSAAYHSLQHTNPQVAASLANNGGLTQTLALLDGSPAINQVPTIGCGYHIGGNDQRGIVRPQGPACDIGAFEFQAPQVSVPVNPVTANATNSMSVNVTYTATASDLDDPSSAPTFACMKEVGNVSVPTGTGVSASFSIGTTTVSCTATDKAIPPDVTRRTFQVIVTDNIDPMLTVPTGNSDPVKVTATGTTGPNGSPANIATANVTLSNYISMSDPIYAANQLKTTCWTDGNANGNPVPADEYFSPSQTETFYGGSTDVGCYVVNPAGNTSGNVYFHINVVDTPSIVFQSGYSDPLTVSATSIDGASLTLTNYLSSSDPITCTASDVNSGNSFPANTGYTFPISTRSVSCTASNGIHTTNAFVFSLTVSPIALTIIAPDFAAADSSEGRSMPYTATVAHNYDNPSWTSLNCWYGTPPDVIYVATGSPATQTFPIGKTTVTCTADDSLGNTITQTFQAVITDYPTLTVPIGNGSPVTAYATSEDGASVDLSQHVSSTDTFLPHVTITCWLDGDKSHTNIYPDYTFPINGSSDTAPATKVDCQAMNSAGFESGSGDPPAPQSFSVQVVDLLGPSVSVPNHTVTVNASKVVKGAVVTLSNYVSVSDPIYEKAHLTIHCTLPPGTNNIYPTAYTFPIGNTTVNCHATNPLGAESNMESFTVSVKDPYNPTMQLPKTITVSTTNPHGVIVGFHIGMSDVIYATNKLTLHCTHVSWSTFGVGTTTLYCSVKNPAGNITRGSFKIVVKYIHR